MADDELEYVRVLPAARDVVFASMTDPEQLAAFWGPEGTTTPLEGIVVELRVGGRFETMIVNDSNGTVHRMRARFDEVQPPQVLAWTETDNGMSTTVTFRDAGPGRTEVTIVQRNVPGPMRSPGARAGFATSLDRIERYLRDHHREDS